MNKRILIESSSQDWQPQFVRNVANKLAVEFDVEVVILPSLYDSQFGYLFGGAPGISGSVVLTGAMGTINSLPEAILKPFDLFLGWLSPRAYRILLLQHGLNLPDMGFPIENLGNWQTVQAGVYDLARRYDLIPGTGVVRDLVFDPAPASRWYPVIDSSQCVNCLECMNFCIFGVYNISDDGTLLIESPDNCRNGCPACARICPQSAILFPRCEDRQISGWEPPRELSGSETETITTVKPVFPAAIKSEGGSGSEQANRERQQYWTQALKEASGEADESIETGTASGGAKTDSIGRLLDDIDSLY